MQAAGDNEGVPKYIQLARILRDKIAGQEYGAGEKIPTESALGETYRVSRITVRQAVDTLVRDNFLQRRQGLGTYVVAQKLRRNIAKVYSFTSDMEQMGLTPGSRVLIVAVEEADDETARSLQLPADNRRVTRLSRVRMANNSPVLRETTLVPEYLCSGLAARDFTTTSLYRVLTEELGLLPHHAEETYEAIILSRQDADLLGCPRRGASPAFAIRRLTFLESGLPIELTQSVGRGDRLTLSISMTSAQADVQRRVEF